MIEFLLNTPDVKFIIRVKGEGFNFVDLFRGNPKGYYTPLKKNVRKRTIIDNLRDKVRIVKCKNVYTKKVDYF